LMFSSTKKMKRKIKYPYRAQIKGGRKKGRYWPLFCPLPSRLGALSLSTDENYQLFKEESYTLGFDADENFLVCNLRDFPECRHLC
jgi:hypothetical protein